MGCATVFSAMSDDESTPIPATLPYGSGTPTIGSLGTRYRVADVIGRGGMGEVVAAQDTQIGREVAIKRLRAADNPRALERFLREACIQGQLDHPAIVPVHEVGVDEAGVPYFVMKKLSGTTLAKRLASATVGERTRLLRAFVDVCLAIEFAHQRGFIHRDLKPENIVLGEFGEVYVLDWGIAKLTQPPTAGWRDGGALATPSTAPGTREGVIVGTPGYMPPEQARGESTVDPRADVYALGCVLFEILAGQRLHPSGDAGMASALRGVDARPSRRASDRDIPPELDAICVVATMVERDARFESARMLADHVQRFLDGDRDLALRASLASELYDQARAAFAGRDDDGERERAMRLAARALALDPQLEGPGELIGRLMLEPPRVMPSAVISELAEQTNQSKKRAARISMVAHTGYLLLLPMLFASGFSTSSYAVALLVLMAANFAALWRLERAPDRASIVPSIVTAAALIGLIARMFSPFFIAPGLAAVIGVAIVLVALPSTRGALIGAIAAMVGAIMVPWAIEELGWWSRSFKIAAEAVYIYSPGVQSETPTSVLVLIAYSVILVSGSMVVAAGVRKAERNVRDQLHLQSWQLRQLWSS